MPQHGDVQEVDAAESVRWMKESGNPWTGYDPRGWEAATWVLHVIYTNDPATHPDAQRIWWRDVVREESLSFDTSLWPGPLWIPHSVPETCFGPEEGELDALSRAAIAEALAGVSDVQQECLFHWCALSLNNGYAQAAVAIDDGLTRAGRVSDWEHCLEEVSMLTEYFPTNVWAVDHSWMVATDWDALGTRVSGPQSLIDALEAHPATECVRCPAA